MELTENLKNEFISSFQRLTTSINNVIDNEYYDYQQVYEIHKTYIEYCKAFQSINCFSSVPLNTKIKFPKQLIKSNQIGQVKLRQKKFFFLVNIQEEIISLKRR